MTIIRTIESPEELDLVKKLWRASSTTLGFFPDGAFQEYMLRRWILGAFGQNHECQGYLSYRVSKSNAVIVHLCVDPQVRGKGIARALFKELTKLTAGCRGATLRCRADYDANALWPRLGFAPVSESSGRSIDGSTLNTWWYDYGEPTLFSPVHDDDRSVGVIDANVFFDLQDPATKRNQESKALMADWLQEYLQLAVTDEIYQEIARNPSKEERARRRAFVSSLLTLQHDHALAAVTEAELRDIIPADGSESTESDRRQLARAIAGSADAFITRDERLLRLHNVIRRRWGIGIVRPVEVIVETDQLERAAKYEPVRLAGTLLTSRLIKGDDIAVLSQTFQNFPAREPLSKFTGVLRDALGDPKRYESRLITDADGQSLALEVVEHSTRRRDLQLLRICAGPLAGTLARHMVWRQVTEAAHQGQDLVSCTDAYSQTAAKAALSEAGFIPIHGGWGRAILRGILSVDQITEHLTKLEQVEPWAEEVRSRLEEPLLEPHAAAHAATAERVLWPARVKSSGLPVFLVPIEPRWALHLFDERLAAQTLFGSEPKLALNVHNVYYRAARPHVIRAPGRVLWYVSKRPQFAGSWHVRAISSVDEVVIGPAKELFKKFKHLGVYAWDDIAALWPDPSTEIMAFTFSGTELLRHPVPWEKLQSVLVEERGRGSQLQSPLEIEESVFERLYRLGTE